MFIVAIKKREGFDRGAGSSEDILKAGKGFVYEEYLI